MKETHGPLASQLILDKIYIERHTVHYTTIHRLIQSMVRYVFRLSLGWREGLRYEGGKNGSVYDLYAEAVTNTQVIFM